MKIYTTPSLVSLGDVRTLTAASSSTSPTDSIVDENGNIIGTLTGSLDACSFQDENGECIADPGDL